MLKINDFTVEYQNNPLGLDELNPRFSWVLESDKNNVVQKNYRIMVEKENGEIVWDTKIVESDNSILNVYQGISLVSKTKYKASIIIENNYEDFAEAELFFETGLLGELVQGDFISTGLIKSDIIPQFNKSFHIDKKIKRARIYATALGLYEIFLNGKRVGDYYDAPYWTSYSHRLQYQTYDITNMLKDENSINVLVANGWYKDYLGFYKQNNIYGTKAGFCADLYLEYLDGSHQVIKTDSSWNYVESKIRKSEFLDGEFIDTNFVDDKEKPVTIIEYDKNKIIGQINEPVRVIEAIKAKEITHSPKGETIIDFGQNVSGIVEFTYKGKKGDKVTIRHAEALDKNGNFYTENLRKAKAEDHYILNGERQTLKPHFTFHGFRYIELIGLDEEFDLKDFNALVLHSDLKKTGNFTCSDKYINSLQSNIVWSQRDNFYDVPTDCPQRDERLGWTGDATVFCRTSTFNYNTFLFFKKWLADLRLEQTEEGYIPQVVPNILGKVGRSSSIWGDSATVIPWTLYTVYGDKRILEDQYESIKAWVESVKKYSVNNLWQSGHQYGDWLGLDKEEALTSRTGATDKYLVASAFYSYSADILAKSAKILGKKQDAAKYKKLHKDIVKAFQNEYITSTGRLVSETQTACVLSLHFGLVPEKHIAKVAQKLKSNIKEHRNHLVTGFAGTPYLNLVLSDNNLNDLAGTLLFKDDFPSWLYQVKMGATTIWERWNGILPDGDFFNPGMNSFNHYAYGSIGDWLYRKVAGIDCLEAGYKKILIRPQPIEGLTEVSATFDSPYGKIGVSYKYDSSRINYEIVIPVNTTADIVLSEKGIITVGSGKYCFEEKTPFTLEEKKYNLDSPLSIIFSKPEFIEMMDPKVDPGLMIIMKGRSNELKVADFLDRMPDMTEIVEEILQVLNQSVME